MSRSSDDRIPKPVLWLKGEVKTPPFSLGARRETGRLLRDLQSGVSIGLPRSHPMPGIGPGCHELRIRDVEQNWRIIYRIDSDAILIVDVFAKTTRATPKRVIDESRRRLARFDEAAD